MPGGDFKATKQCLVPQPSKVFYRQRHMKLTRDADLLQMKAPQREVSSTIQTLLTLHVEKEL